MQALIEFTSANPLLVSGVVASALAVIFYELKLKARDVGSVSIPVAIRMINQGNKVIDVRDSEKFATGHIVDAANIPAAELQADPGKLKDSKKGTLLVCDTGVKSAELVVLLRKAGRENVFAGTAPALMLAKPGA